MIRNCHNILQNSLKVMQCNVLSKRLLPVLTNNTNNCCPTMIKSICIQKYVRSISMSPPKLQKDEIQVTFKRASGEVIKTKAKVGDTLLDVVVNNSIDLDGFGACEGTLTCSTCHLIFKQDDYDKLPEKPGDEEMDMLDLAYDLTDTSRLGCQITLTKDMDGLEVTVPSTINDARS